MTKEMLEYLRKELKRKFLSTNNLLTDEMAQDYEEKLSKLRQLLSDISGLSQDDYNKYLCRKNAETLKNEMQKIDDVASEYQDCINFLHWQEERNLRTSILEVIHEVKQSFIKAQHNKASEKDIFLREYNERKDCCASVSVVRDSTKRSIEVLESELVRYKSSKPIVEKAFKDIDAMLSTVKTDN